MADRVLSDYFERWLETNAGDIIATLDQKPKTVEAWSIAFAKALREHAATYGEDKGKRGIFDPDDDGEDASLEDPDEFDPEHF